MSVIAIGTPLQHLFFLRTVSQNSKNHFWNPQNRYHPNLNQLTNLTPIQHKALRQLKDDKQLIIKPTDKNLGLALMDRDTCIRQVLREYLLTDSYMQLTKNEATTHMESIKSMLKNIFHNNQHILSKPEATYFKRSLTTHFRLPMFYGIPKVHKSPISLRPVVGSSNSLLSVFSIWLLSNERTATTCGLLPERLYNFH
jgi:hypothetical protein